MITVGSTCIFCAVAGRAGGSRLMRLAARTSGRLLERRNPAREGLDRVRDWIRQVDPVGVGTFRTPALDANRVPWVPNHGRLRWNVMDDNRIRADLRSVANGDRAEQLGPRPDRDVVLDGRMPLAGREPCAAECDALVEGDVVSY